MNITYVANPVHLNAVRILEMTDVTDRCGAHSSRALQLRLEDGRDYRANMGMASRYVPAAGDYLVTQEHGYEYLNPRDVFERKYHPITAANAALDFGEALELLKAGARVTRALIVGIGFRGASRSERR